jgi:hypothetical protein
MKTETILKKYKTGRLTVEEVLLALDKIGHCPNLLNDDARRWALISEGLQNVPDPNEPTDIETSFYVEAECWKPTIREAILYYLEKE